MTDSAPTAAELHTSATILPRLENVQLKESTHQNLDSGETSLAEQWSEIPSVDQDRSMSCIPHTYQQRDAADRADEAQAASLATEYPPTPNLAHTDLRLSSKETCADIKENLASKHMESAVSEVHAYATPPGDFEMEDAARPATLETNCTVDAAEAADQIKPSSEPGSVSSDEMADENMSVYAKDTSGDVAESARSIHQAQEEFEAVEDATVAGPCGLVFAPPLTTTDDQSVVSMSAEDQPMQGPSTSWIFHSKMQVDHSTIQSTDNGRYAPRDDFSKVAACQEQPADNNNPRQATADEANENDAEISADIPHPVTSQPPRPDFAMRGEAASYDGSVPGSPSTDGPPDDSSDEELAEPILEPQQRSSLDLSSVMALLSTYSPSRSVSNGRKRSRDGTNSGSETDGEPTPKRLKIGSKAEQVLTNTRVHEAMIVSKGKDKQDIAISAAQDRVDIDPNGHYEANSDGAVDSITPRRAATLSCPESRADDVAVLNVYSPEDRAQADGFRQTQLVRSEEEEAFHQSAASSEDPSRLARGTYVQNVNTEMQERIATASASSTLMTSTLPTNAVDRRAEMFALPTTMESQECLELVTVSPTASPSSEASLIIDHNVEKERTTAMESQKYMTTASASPPASTTAEPDPQEQVADQAKPWRNTTTSVSTLTPSGTAPNSTADSPKKQVQATSVDVQEHGPTVSDSAASVSTISSPETRVERSESRAQTIDVVKREYNASMSVPPHVKISTPSNVTSERLEQNVELTDNEMQERIAAASMSPALTARILLSDTPAEEAALPAPASDEKMQEKSTVAPVLPHSAPSILPPGSTTELRGPRLRFRPMKRPTAIESVEHELLGVDSADTRAVQGTLADFKTAEAENMEIKPTQVESSQDELPQVEAAELRPAQGEPRGDGCADPQMLVSQNEADALSTLSTTSSELSSSASEDLSHVTQHAELPFQNQTSKSASPPLEYLVQPTKQCTHPPSPLTDDESLPSALQNAAPSPGPRSPHGDAESRRSIETSPKHEAEFHYERRSTRSETRKTCDSDGVNVDMDADVDANEGRRGAIDSAPAPGIKEEEKQEIEEEATTSSAPKYHSQTSAHAPSRRRAGTRANANVSPRTSPSAVPAPAKAKANAKKDSSLLSRPAAAALSVQTRGLPPTRSRSGGSTALSFSSVTKSATSTSTTTSTKTKTSTTTPEQVLGKRKTRRTSAVEEEERAARAREENIVHRLRVRRKRR